MMRRHSLDDQHLCFLTARFNEQKELESISFDVEAADDYHYQIFADQLPKLCEYLQCQNDDKEIATALSERLKTWNNPIEIAEICRQAGIKYQVHHWY